MQMHDDVGAKQNTEEPVDDTENNTNEYKNEEMTLSKPPPLISRNDMGTAKALPAEYMGIDDFFSVLLSKESSIPHKERPDYRDRESPHHKTSYNRSPKYENSRSFSHYASRRPTLSFRETSEREHHEREREREYYASKHLPTSSSSSRSMTSHNVSYSPRKNTEINHPYDEYDKKYYKYKTDEKAELEAERIQRMRYHSEKTRKTVSRDAHIRSVSTSRYNEQSNDSNSSSHNSKLKRLQYEEFMHGRSNAIDDSLSEELQKRQLYKTMGRSRSTDSIDMFRPSLVARDNSYESSTSQRDLQKHDETHETSSVEDEDLVVDDDDELTTNMPNDESALNTANSSPCGSPQTQRKPFLVPRGSNDAPTTYDTDSCSSLQNPGMTPDHSVQRDTEMPCDDVDTEGTEDPSLMQSDTMTKDTNSNNTPGTGEKRKRGGGKIGRRRKRGYIYDPKPLITKSKISQLPSEVKDTDYWDKRRRNNEAAKRSRENRRIKELETITVAKELSQENEELKSKIKQLEERNRYLENLLASKTILGGTSS